MSSLQQPVRRTASRFIPAGTPVVVTHGPLEGLIGEFPKRPSPTASAASASYNVNIPLVKDGEAASIDLNVSGVRDVRGTVGSADEWFVQPVRHTTELRHLKPLEVALREGWIYRWKWYVKQKHSTPYPTMVRSI